MSKHIKHTVMALLIAPVAISSVYSSTSREITFDVTKLEPKHEEILHENVGSNKYYRGASEYAALIASLAKNDELNLRVYDKLKSLTLEDELLEEVSKFERIDKDNYKKLIQACLRTVKMNAVGRYQTIDDLVETNFVDSLCRTVGHMENVENLRNGIWFCTDIPIDDVTDEELYQKMCDRLKSLVD